MTSKLTFTKSLFLLLVFYTLILFLFHFDKLSYQFNPNLIPLYLRSQDIPHEVAGRVFLSDEEIHQAAGYLYIKGADPTTYNFQHPPLVKYFYGLGIKLFNNPYLPQFLISFGVIIITFLIGLKAFRNIYIPFIGTLLLITDPLFQEISTGLYLDMAQTLFGLIFIYLRLFKPKHIFWAGLSLGLMTASKFWTPALFVFGLTFLWEYYQTQKFPLSSYFKIAILAFIVFSFTYAHTFIQHKLAFNIIFFQLKTLKYWLHHSVSTYPFATLISFITGIQPAWWGQIKTIKLPNWSPLWPVLLIINLIYLIIYKTKITSSPRPKHLIFIIPPLYLFFISLQAPFNRYYIFILPYLYLSFTLCVSHLISFLKSNSSP